MVITTTKNLIIIIIITIKNLIMNIKMVILNIKMVTLNMVIIIKMGMENTKKVESIIRKNHITIIIVRLIRKIDNSSFHPEKEQDH